MLTCYPHIIPGRRSAVRTFAVLPLTRCSSVPGAATARLDDRRAAGTSA